MSVNKTEREKLREFNIEALADFLPAELTWLYTHCRAIGMDCKSQSGKWEHDICLFTINQKSEIERLQRQLAEQPRAAVPDGDSNNDAN